MDVGPGAAADDTARCLEGMVKAARDVERSLGDLRAYGTWLATSRPDTCAELVARIGILEDAAASIDGLLRSSREAYLAAQLQTLRIDASARDLRLHIGAGPNAVPGWINIDLPPAELALDLRWGLPFADGSAALVYSAHCLEHQYLKDALHTLREIHRVLAPGGRVRLVVPDIETYARAYVEDDRAFFAERRRTWHWLPDGLTHLMTVIGYAGAGARAVDGADLHRYGYDFATLEFLLRRVGFHDVVRTAYMSGPRAELLLDEHSSVAGAHHAGRACSLFVEAGKRPDPTQPAA